MKRKLLALVVGGILGVTAPGFAANQLTNPNFPTDTSWWTPGGLWGVTWTSTEGRTALGAARVQADSAAGSIGAQAFSQCTTATGGVTYDFGGAFKIDTASTQTGGGRIRVTWYDAASCTGTSTAGPNVDPTNAAGWQFLQLDNAVAPAGAASTLFEVIQVIDGAGTFTAFWDDFYFGPDPLPVELQSFTAE